MEEPTPIEPAPRNYKKLRLWDSAQRLSLLIQKLSYQSPLCHRANLADQIRRAALSIPSNIAEGMGRGTNRDCLKFLFIAQGSLKELESQVETAIDGGFISTDKIDPLRQLLELTGRDLGGLIYTRCKRLKIEGLAPRRHQRPRPQG